jgi:hypothetical protein
VTLQPFLHSQPLEQIAKQQYELKALSNNQIKIQPKPSESYQTITQGLTEKRTEFHTHRLKRRKELQSSFKKYALLNQPRRN